MNSQLAARMDGGDFLFESSTLQSMLEELRDQYGVSSYGKAKFTCDQLYWMGYLYRYWCCLYGITSRKAFQTCGSRELCELFEPYHTLDPQQAIARILEAKDVDLNYTSIQRGVETLRSIRAKGRFDYYLMHLE